MKVPPAPVALVVAVAVAVAVAALYFHGRATEGMTQRASAGSEHADGLKIPTPDLKPLPLTAYSKTAQPLKCPKQGKRVGGGNCTFGLYTLTGKAFDGGKVAVVLSDHLAGAVYKITYDGTEFVHPVPIVGASMQTALSFDTRVGGSAEQMNPTEAGCAELDSFTGRSSSKMLDLRAGTSGGPSVYTRTRPAYFRKPGMTLMRHGKRIPVLNKTVLSDVELAKQFTFAAPGVLDCVITVKIPDDKYYFSQIAYVSAWAPWASSSVMEVFISSGGGGGRWVAMPGVTPTPRAKGFVVSDGARAMGVTLVEAPSGGMWTPGYYGNLSQKTGEWRHWSLVQKVGSTKNYTQKIPGGVYAWKVRYYFGPLDRVKKAIEGS